MVGVATGVCSCVAREECYLLSVLRATKVILGCDGRLHAGRFPVTHRQSRPPSSTARLWEAGNEFVAVDNPGHGGRRGEGKNLFL
jgi:hypothetical protein